MRGHRAAAVATILLSIALPSIAHAGEDELILAVEPGWALLHFTDDANHGGAAGVSAWLGVTETIWLAASTGIALGFVEKSAVSELLAGIVVALDVLRVVPYGEALIGAVASKETVEPSFRFGLGADYLISPAIGIGLVARYRPLTDTLGGDGLFTAQVRLSLRIEL